MDLVFDDRALADIESIYRWIAEDSPASAKIVVDRLFGSVELLTSFPFMGHAGHDPETFEWVVPRLPYIVVYEVDQDRQRIIVVAVFHGSQSREDNANPRGQI
jgi:plasmid stabilization system protein ParE